MLPHGNSGHVIVGEPSKGEDGRDTTPRLPVVEWSISGHWDANAAPRRVWFYRKGRLVCELRQPAQLPRGS